MRQLHRNISQIADDRFHFLTDIAHFGEFGRFNLDERHVRKLG
ncbi:Uncharacterised protein [Vibrio cholerae]|nr:Uncharacterised protein [Vibrio cholerae]CSB43609.1 Uncharacterised protein [Vibrio cholerae]CSD22965.1 Uncharacterised protein [Vibrio cholerae]CSI80960.1 Uncharacterised protein [Vibrio cholerae]